ncbi:MAG TPA: pyridoxamine 5'-phosphate oxidase family protein [Hyphomonas sp.]|nr:pyridoxamine 5'-phosphate oxidase family protein [Hyphomonas sp.]
MEDAPGAVHGALGPSEAGFISARDSFYMASVSETGWPYVQHRGGPPGFVRILSDTLIGFADFRGNRQYISAGNLSGNDRVALFFMDYPNKTRLKLYGRAQIIRTPDRALLDQLEMPGYRARVEQAVLISVEAFDWNCPQHITERFTLQEMEAAVAPLKQRIAMLEAAVESDAATKRSGGII